MKKILFIVAIIMAGVTSAFAQTESGEMGGGINLLYGTEVGNLGVGAKYRYCLTDEFRAEGTLDYFFKNDHHTMIDLNANIQYLLPIENTEFVVYPLLGLGIGNDHYCHPSFNNTIVGINAGCGVEFAITDKACLTAEARYQFFNENCTQLLIGFGLVHKF